MISMNGQIYIEEAIKEQKLMKKIIDNKDEQCFVEEKKWEDVWRRLVDGVEEMPILYASRIERGEQSRRGVWRQG